jgi:hypothetical protein
MKQNNVSHNNALTETLLTLGWIVMVNGQSFVLYSRLNLLTHNRKLMRFLFWLIVVDGIILCVPCTVLNSGQYVSSNPEVFTYGYSIMEKIQLSWFTAQEIIISGVYFWEVRKALRVISDGRTRKFLWQLVAMNVVVLLLDLSQLLVECFNYYQIETTLKALIYSVKLKIEFAVLSQLVGAVTNRDGASDNIPSNALEHPAPLSDQENQVLPADLTFVEELLASQEKSSTSAPSSSLNSAVSKTTTSSPQGNLPPEWRVSLSNESLRLPVHPGLHREESNGAGSLISIEKMYPGRLG